MSTFVNNDVSSGDVVLASDHNTQGSLLAAVLNGGIDNANIASGAAIAGSKLADAGITAEKLSTSTITLGYTQITSNASNSATSATAVGSLTVTVTIPSGGRKVKITAWTEYLSNNTAGHNTYMTIWDGTVGSGTQLAQAKAFSVNNSTGNQATAIAVVTPAAGSKTYNVGLHGDNAGVTNTIDAAATYPAFILVETI